jgi:inner membrane protein
MDNLTHTLTGVVMSRAGLNRWYPRAGMVLMLAANIPDIDIVTALRGALPYFEAHRGYTHAIAMLPVMAVIPMLVACAVSRSMRG